MGPAIRSGPRRRRRRSAAVALITIVASFASFASFAGCGSASPKQRPTPTGNLSAVPAAVRAGDALTIALLQQLGRGAGNVVFSPYSIETALSMVGTGAAGSTATQIEHVLHTTNPAAVAAGLAAIDARLTAASGARDAPRVHLANGLWVQSGFALEKPFTKTLSSAFGALPQTVNFKSAPDVARQKINSWVAARTAHLITNLFPTGTITGQTALVLANAIYLAAHWANPFTSSQPGPFYTGAGPAVRVPFMTQTPAQVPYARGRGYQALALPYLSSHLSMLMVMPAPGTFARFEQGLGAGAVARLERALVPTRIALHMPKFHLHFDAGLEPALSALGMPVAFTDAADFSRITTQTGLKISAVQHAADLRVDEQGTVAAAATGIAVQPTAISPSPAVPLTLDHPFLLFLRDDASGAILFVAQVTNPR